MQTYGTWSQTVHTTAKALWDNFIIHYALPEKILSDQGCNLESELITNFCRVSGTKKLVTVPYHPRPMAHVKDSTPPSLPCWGHYTPVAKV